MKAIFVLSGILLLGIVHPALGQERDRSVSDFELRIPTLPYYSFGSGLGLTSPDSTFRLNIRFRMQNRTTFVSNENEEDRIEASVRRLRLRFDGFVGDPRFLYAIQLSFAPGDVGEITPGDNLNIIRDAVFFYRPNDRWSIGFGQTKLPGNRQRVNSSGALQFTDRSINNARFNIDRDYGIFLNFQEEHRNQFSYAIKTAISTGDGRNYTRNSDTRLAYTGRIELFPMGTFQSNGFLFEGDLKREETPKVLLGATFHYNKDARRTQGQLGPSLFETRDLRSIFLDGMLKYRGFAFQTAYMNRYSENPLTFNPQDQTLFNFVQTGHGLDFQASYLFPSDYEIAARFSTLQPGSKIKMFQPQIDQYSVGFTRYIWEHALKLQTELTATQTNHPVNGKTTGWYARFQVEIGI